MIAMNTGWSVEPKKNNQNQTMWEKYFQEIISALNFAWLRDKQTTFIFNKDLFTSSDSVVCWYKLINSFMH